MIADGASIRVASGRSLHRDRRRRYEATSRTLFIRCPGGAIIIERLTSLVVTDSSPEPTTPADPTHEVDVPGTSPPPLGDVDLDAVERDLAAVEAALHRLSEGTYWTDEVTGEPIAEHVLTADPTARRA
jgi:hypothetical protein